MNDPRNGTDGATPPAPGEPRVAAWGSGATGRDAGATATAPRPVREDDLLRVTWVADPRMSPDIETRDVPPFTPGHVVSVAEQFVGKIMQKPPMYSAVKINGKKLYNLARKGKSIVREPRKIFIEKFEIEKIHLPDMHFTNTCSKGTFIRVIADDFGKKLNCGGVLMELRRTEIGEFGVDQAIKMDELSSQIFNVSAS